MQKTFFTLAALLFAIIAFNSCKNNKYEAFNSICDTTNTKFSAVINPILTNKCLACHNNTTMNGGINLEGYDNVKANYDAVLNSTRAGRMPKDGPLDSCTISKIQTWVNRGANNN